ncbi:MAG: hypothetical protein PSV17_03305 [Methylotenera sp.]|uniref:hypothetical protein n=1 Tax=Methylotenera sp. TaxID=2051956 RepID=UPI002487435B|nr:hypothetical protein [Methylotenera sp.]MDI1308444.1 hypothetical protein [Methylotenera sp.]
MTNKKTRLLLFFDTEFTHFIDIDLISIGVVSQHSHEFYAENAEYQKAWCSDFVNSVVLPKLQGGKYAMPYSQLQVKIQCWISGLLEEYASILFIYDYCDDWDLLIDLLTDYPQMDKIQGIKEDVSDLAELYFLGEHPNQHHALFDAKVLMNDFKMKYADSEPRH